MPQTPAGAAATPIDQARRMEIVGQLTGGVVHDFNNILTVISGTIEILADAVADRPDLAAIAALIADAAARGANLTANLLAFSRGQPSQPCEVNLNTLLVDAARLLRPTLGEQIEVDTVPGTGLATALVDPHRLMAAILNLAILARDVMPEGGRLTLGAADALPEDIGFNGEINAANFITVTVSTVRHETSGDQADLAFADPDRIENFIVQAGGHMSVCREAGGSTSVRIVLPRAIDMILPVAEAAGEGGDEAILIVEDDVLLRSYVMIQVEGLGYRTRVACDTSEALAIIDEDDSIDLLFTDVVMPGALNGRQLTIEALKRRPALKVLYTSGYARDAMTLGGGLVADGLFLAKPYRKVDLAKMIRAALAA